MKLDIDFSSFEKTSYPKYSDFLLWMNKVDLLLKENGFTFIGQGSTRRTFLSPNKNYVIKVPLYQMGIDANISEHKAYRYELLSTPKNERRLAPCRLYGKLLIMEAVNSTFGSSDGDRQAFESKMLIPRKDAIPDWASKFFVDCDQIGSLKDGRLVIYDYAEVV